MAQVEVKDNGGKKKKGQQKKMNIHVDFTPMVDMNMLLITFFMLCTTMTESRTMDLVMPAKLDPDKVLENQAEARASSAITILIGNDDRIFYYEGLVNDEDFSNPDKLKETYLPGKTAESQGQDLRAYLSEKNKAVQDDLLKFNQDFEKEVEVIKSRGLSDEVELEQIGIAEAKRDSLSNERRKADDSPVVIIKVLPDLDEFESWFGEDDQLEGQLRAELDPIEGSRERPSYEAFVDVLDELTICSIGTFAVDEMNSTDVYLLTNYLTKGAFGVSLSGENPSGN